MKKILSSLTIFALIFSISIPAFAADFNEAQTSQSFEISLEEALSLANPADITVQNGITSIPGTLNIDEEVYTEIIIRVDNLSRSCAKSFSMEGWFR